MNPTLSQRIQGFLHPLNRMLTPTPIMLEVARAKQPVTPPLNPNDPTAAYEAYFSPRGGCAEALAREIAKATIRLRIQAYQLTHPDVEDAILNRINAGVPTEIILDKTQQQYDFGKKCQAAGAKVYDDHTVKIAHNKVALIEYEIPGNTRQPHLRRIDSVTPISARVLIQGSFNFTNNADESNAENMVIHRTYLRPADLAPLFDAFALHFDTRKSASMEWGTEHAMLKLGVDFESVPETLEERNERLNG